MATIIFVQRHCAWSDKFGTHSRCRLSLPLRERKDFLGFGLFAKSLENPSEGVV